MFSVEHKFSKTRITLIDEGSTSLQEDVILDLDDEGAKITKYDERTGEDVTINLSRVQINDLISALHCPEGVFLRGR